MGFGGGDVRFFPFFLFFFFFEGGGEGGREGQVYVYIMKEAKEGMKEGMKGMEGRKYMQRCLRARQS